MPEVEMAQALERARKEIQFLQERLTRLEMQGTNSTQPRTNLLSDKFLTRAFAVLGHYLVASLIIFVPIYALILIIALAIGARF
ncbi:hypothetical protein HUU05_27135 [candidate division KSB1 bacterium]|nr:hypothetical protein [candidate division KSB1 bacterium]